MLCKQRGLFIFYQGRKERKQIEETFRQALVLQTANAENNFFLKNRSDIAIYYKFYIEGHNLN
jgi:hypothetical protein